MTKTIIITGASRGIGLAIAKYLLGTKTHQLVLSARSPAPLKELQKQDPDLIEVVTVDMAEPDSGKIIVDKAIARFGKVDSLIINHGVLDPVRKVGDATGQDWKTCFDINFFSAIDLVRWAALLWSKLMGIQIQTALPSLRKGKGNIIVTSSGAAIKSYTGWGAYGATKAALNHLVATLGAEESDVTSISIRPGVVDTEMQREIREVHGPHMSSSASHEFSDLFSSGRLLKPEQPGHVIAKLALDAPANLSGKFLS
jgi:NAD(P)-dependent dehydrogenase (short-subunit alcohol dehydrogenase family)